ncbi:hypothetical protein CONLIGDRAFT_687270 [Coniochaeta ligniaria NRRL 30616]|uniref:Uncharacterized protein n=1 Tax=Coniochaeta ligniaria NRRL 30616 TaxID=1408157 RepID=A0A1J7I5Y4_9PEZI|nr:hypothetical protein CONLIGDRAFT_687270 [Coniochaeta ligniaria NRRL 30616]
MPPPPNPQQPPIQPWRRYDEIPHLHREIADHFIKAFLERSCSTQDVNDNGVRQTFFDAHVFDDGAWTVNMWVYEQAIESGDQIFIKPSIKMDNNYPAFLYVRNGHTLNSSQDISLYPHLESFNQAKVLAMAQWDCAEVKRITAFNLGLTVYWVRKTLLKQWLLLSDRAEQSTRVNVGMDKGKLVQLKTMHSCLEKALALATLAQQELQAPRYWHAARALNQV